MQVFVSVFPVFLAFSIIALVVFGQYSARFVSVGRTFVALFAVSSSPCFFVCCTSIAGLLCILCSTVLRDRVSLFQVVNGDAMRETFEHVETARPLWLSLFGDLFMYSFVCFLMYVGLNILIAVNEDGFFKSSAQERAGMFSPPVKVLLLRLEAEDEAKKSQ